MSETLDKLINFRVTESIREAWKKEAKNCDMNLGDWIRGQVKIGGVPVPATRKPTPTKLPEKRRHVKADPDLIHHLSKIGANLNQVARWVNTHKHGVHVAEVIVWLEDIKEDLRKYKVEDDLNAH